MKHDVRVAVIASWLPRFAPPIGDCDLDVPYEERVHALLSVEDEATLATVYSRAVDALAPRAVKGSEGYVENPLDVARWTLFYEPADADGISSKVWEVAEDLIVVSEDGRGRWSRSAEEITYSDLLRAGQRGLLRGDPRRPYLTLLLPQGRDAFVAAWSGLFLVWTVLGHLLQARELCQILRGLRRRETQNTLDAGLRVVERHHAHWSTSRAGPSQLLETLDRRPWHTDDLGILLGLDTVDEAHQLLRLYGFCPGPSGQYELGENDEARILRTIANDGSWGWLDVTEPHSDAQERIAHLLETGELPRDEIS